MKHVLLIIFAIMCVSCVSGPPRLTQEQQKRLETIVVFQKGENPSKEYSKIKSISAADCKGAPGGGRVWGNAERAINSLKMKAAALDADAIIKTSCGTAPFVNNCWAAKKCKGIAVKWDD